MTTTRSAWGTLKTGSPRRATPLVGGTGPKVFQDVQAFLDVAIHCSSSVLISGGELRVRRMLARCIHQESGRQDGPFVVVDYRGVPDAFLTSSLGSIFLEDVDALSPEAQARMVAVFTRRLPGETHMRVIAGASYDLPDLVRAGDFSADLFGLLSALHLVIG